jgi:hypothetical protein
MVTRRAHGQQRLCHQFDPGGILPRPERGRGQRPRAPQFGLGQLPQVGFRALAVDVLSVLPEARSSSLAEVVAAARESRAVGSIAPRLAPAWGQEEGP